MHHYYLMESLTTILPLAQTYKPEYQSRILTQMPLPPLPHNFHYHITLDFRLRSRYRLLTFRARVFCILDTVPSLHGRHKNLEPCGRLQCSGAVCCINVGVYLLLVLGVVDCRELEIHGLHLCRSLMLLSVKRKWNLTILLGVRNHVNSLEGGLGK